MAPSSSSSSFDGHQSPHTPISYHSSSIEGRVRGGGGGGGRTGGGGAGGRTGGGGGGGGS